MQVRGHVASVSSTLQYENKEERPLEAIFVFPLEGDTALCHFSAKIGETEVVAELQEKQKVREEWKAKSKLNCKPGVGAEMGPSHTCASLK